MMSPHGEESSWGIRILSPHGIMSAANDSLSAAADGSFAYDDWGDGEPPSPLRFSGPAGSDRLSRASEREHVPSEGKTARRKANLAGRRLPDLAGAGRETSPGGRPSAEGGRRLFRKGPPELSQARGRTPQGGRTERLWKEPASPILREASLARNPSLPGLPSDGWPGTE